MILNVLEIAIVPIIVALIAAGGSIIAVRKLSKRNDEQHDTNAGLLIHLSNQVGGIDTKVDRLGVWQAEHDKQHLTEPSYRIDL